MATKHRIALVTGAAQGMGQAFSRRLAADGLYVIAVDLRESKETVQQIEAAGGQAHARVTDITDIEQCTALVESVQQDLGGVDVLVNNAALHGNPLVAIVDMEPETWNRIMAVNVDAPFRLTQLALPGMIERGWGRIINMSSSSLNGIAPGGMTHYMASKGAVVGFTRGLANEVGDHGITVNAIAPHGVNSPGAAAFENAEEINALVVAGQAIKRLSEPEDIAGAVSFLASDDAAMITAQVLHVDAGVIRAG